MPFRLPPVTMLLLVLNIAVFLADSLLGPPPDALRGYSTLEGIFALWPWYPDGYGSGLPVFMPWQLVSYAFLHGSFNHIAFNMLALVMFGSPIEYHLGTRRYLLYYAVCVIGAGLCQLALASWSVAQGSDIYPTVGASGGVFGLLLAYGLLFPNHRVMLLFPPIPMKARTLVIVYGAIELLLGFTGLQPGVAHFAHLGGMLFGWLLLRYWRRPRPPQRPRFRVVT